MSGEAISSAWNILDQEGILSLLNRSTTFAKRSFIFRLLESSYMDPDDIRREFQTWYLEDDIEDLSIKTCQETVPHRNNPIVDIKNEPIFSFERPSVSEIEDAILVGDRPIVFTHDGKITDIQSGKAPQYPRRANVHVADEALKYPDQFLSLLTHGKCVETTKNQDIGCLLYLDGNNYYHWLMDHALKLRSISYYEEMTGQEATIITGAETPQYMKRLYELLGYGDRYIEWTGQPTSVNSLVMPSFPDPTPRNLNWLKQSIQEKVDECVDEDTPEWIYISRQNATRRRVANFSEVRSVLEDHGVQILHPEKISLDREVHIMRNAEGIISPHGAGLTSMIWGDNLTIMELFNQVVTGPYYILSNVLGHQYDSLVQEATGDGKPVHQNIIVDVEELNSKLCDIIH